MDVMDGSHADLSSHGNISLDFVMLFVLNLLVMLNVCRVMDKVEYDGQDLEEDSHDEMNIYFFIYLYFFIFFTQYKRRSCNNDKN